MKRILSFLLILSLIIAVSPSTALAYPTDSTRSHFPSVKVSAKLDNKTIKWTALRPYKLGYISMIPIKPIAVALGYKWSSKGKAVRLTKGSKAITFTAGSNKVVINGVTKMLVQKTTIKQNQVFGNYECFKTLFNITSNWNYKTNKLILLTVVVKQNEIPIPSNVKVNFNSKALAYKVQGAYLSADGTPMIPVQLIADQLGYIYSATTKDAPVRITKGNEIISFTIGTNKLNINGIEKTYSNAIVLQANKVCVSKEMISDMFKIPCDYFVGSKTVRMYTAALEQVKLYTLLKDSGMYVTNWPDIPSENGYGAEMFPIGKNGEMSLHVTIPVTNDPNIHPLALAISITKPNPEIRSTLDEIYKIAYPSSYTELKRTTMSVLLEEVYALEDIIGRNSPGIDMYNDGRYLRIAKNINGSCTLYVNIGELNTTYPQEYISEPKYQEHSSKLQEYIKEYTLGY